MAGKLSSLTTEEVAAIIQTTPANVRQMLNSGELHGFKIGTRGPKAQWRVTTAELERFMGEAASVNE